MYIWRCGSSVKKIRCQNYIDESHHIRCWNMATTLAIIQHKNPSQQIRMWICDGCFKLRFLNDERFGDQLLQVINLAREE